WLSDLVQEGRDMGQIRSKYNPRTTALRILTSIFAATQLARITGDDDFSSVKNSLLDELSN
ncbi:MAG: TetR/AcrR family transcriptional regulator, partial [Bacteroidetes bacterium]|nr:TetR/AcrR family transcriptional regulator [Bacteroidota bacterium]